MLLQIHQSRRLKVSAEGDHDQRSITCFTLNYIFAFVLI